MSDKYLIGPNGYVVINFIESSMFEQEPFLFYGQAKKDFGWMFSNFSPHSVEAFGATAKTSEHLFQAMKFQDTDPEYFQSVLDAPTPFKSKTLGRSRNHPMRKDWEDVKDEIMYDIVAAKVEQHPEIKKALLSTGNRRLIEASPKDSYWGWGKDKNGRNQLGKTLMKIRDTYK